MWNVNWICYIFMMTFICDTFFSLIIISDNIYLIRDKYWNPRFDLWWFIDKYFFFPYFFAIKFVGLRMKNGLKRKDLYFDIDFHFNYCQLLHYWIENLLIGEGKMILLEEYSIKKLLIMAINWTDNSLNKIIYLKKLVKNNELLFITY